MENSNILMHDLNIKGFELVRPIEVEVSCEEGDCVASYPEADIHMSGDTLEDALNNLGEVIVSRYKIYRDLNISKLGPLPKKQLKVLASILKETS